MVKERYNHWLPPLLGARAVTLVDTIYYEGSQDSIKHRLRKHEMVHIEQFQKLGAIMFFALYFYEYFKGRLQGMKHWEAYMNISLEKEAYKKENI